MSGNVVRLPVPAVAMKLVSAVPLPEIGKEPIRRWSTRKTNFEACSSRSSFGSSGWGFPADRDVPKLLENAGSVLWLCGVNVVGVLFALWGTVNLRRGKPYGENAIRKIWNAANLQAHKKYQTPLINPYNGLKHSFGCQRLNEGFGLAEVQAVMGHADARTTQRYAEYVTKKLSGVMRGKIALIENAKKTDKKQTGTDND